LHVVRRPPHRRGGRLGVHSIRKGRLGARSILGLLLTAGVTLAGVGFNVASAETPAQKIARLRGQAAQVQARIDHMNDQVEIVVEQFNANRVALQATMDRQHDTARRLEDARKRLDTAQNRMADRVRAIYMGGPVTGLEQMLEVQSPADAVRVAQYQESASDADVQTIAAVRQRRQELTSIAADLNGQRDRQEQLQAKLDGQRRDIEAKLAQQRDYLARLGTDVKRAVAEEQQRQDALQRQALARAEAAPQAGVSASGGAGSGPGVSSTSNGSSLLRVSTSSASASTSAGGRAVAYAKAQLGKPYAWGAQGPGSFDCSGLTMMAWRSAGVSIPRTSSAQYSIGRHTSRTALQPGDLVFFGSDIHHVGIYAGGGQMIEAPYTGQVVRYRTIDRSDYAGATRPTG
jgi:cell wall-associated NlpC family hydrolase